MIPDWAYPLLFATGVAAGFVDAIAGGGGLITLPVLLNFGLPPQDALGTNKLQSTFGSTSATWHFGRAGLIDFRASVPGVVLTFLGAVGGTVAVQQFRPEFLRWIIPWLLLGLAVYTLVQPRLGEQDRQPRLSVAVFYVLAGLGLGFYDGFFGPGTGTFWAMAFVLGLGFNLMRATAHTKLMNFTSNLASLLAFAAGGHLVLGAGLTMGVGQWLGAQLGARVVIRRGTKFIRPVFVTIAIAVTARLVWENFRSAG